MFDTVVKNGSLFNGNMAAYWGFIAALLVVYFFVLLFKYYTLNLSVIKASTSVH
jgi:hypothetical protein